MSQHWVQLLAVLIEVGTQSQRGDVGAVVGNTLAPAGIRSSELGQNWEPHTGLRLQELRKI